MKSHKYKWLLFDADGTLFDFEKTEVIALQQTIEQSVYHYEIEMLSELNDLLDVAHSHLYDNIQNLQ